MGGTYLQELHADIIGLCALVFCSIKPRKKILHLQSKHQQSQQIPCLDKVCFSFEISNYCYQQHKLGFM